MLSLDDYFMTETEKVEKDPDTGKKVKKKVKRRKLLVGGSGCAVLWSVDFSKQSVHASAF